MTAVPGGSDLRVVMQNAAVAVGNGTAAVTIDPVQYASTTLTMQVVGITTATITFEATLDDVPTWVAVQATNLATGVAATTATADGIYRIVCAGLRQVRARISAWTAGATTVTGELVA